MWSVALRVGGRGRGGDWFVVLWRTFVAFRRSSGRHKWRPYVCGWLIVVSRWLVCGVVRGGAIHDARCRNGTCGRSHCVSVDAGGASVERCFVAVIRASQVAPLRLRAVECGFASVIRASQVAPLRLRVVECCFASVIRASQMAPLRLRVVDCCFAGGCWRRNGGLSGEGDGYEKKKPD